ncbi:hypothetical protein [Halobacillus sp. B23F22_1]|uniref:hypothetical protein n=1 Tax=Halobacillus sp. B23F22_1 TaxID=3459514 RepID=UPI00373EFCEE
MKRKSAVFIFIILLTLLIGIQKVQPPSFGPLEEKLTVQYTVAAVSHPPSTLSLSSEEAYESPVPFIKKALCPIFVPKNKYIEPHSVYSIFYQENEGFYP